ncbi:hypothetical protein OAO42_00555 [Candidatus Izimaplasma bacterium]|nr:hypothetical protein [Candidatus Izimaplasma bacterium]
MIELVIGLSIAISIYILVFIILRKRAIKEMNFISEEYENDGVSFFFFKYNLVLQIIFLNFIGFFGLYHIISYGIFAAAPFIFIASYPWYTLDVRRLSHIYTITNYNNMMFHDYRRVKDSMFHVYDIEKIEVYHKRLFGSSVFIKAKSNSNSYQVRLYTKNFAVLLDILIKHTRKEIWQPLVDHLRLHNKFDSKIDNIWKV